MNDWEAQHALSQHNREQRQDAGRKRRANAAAEFEEAAIGAEQFSMTLRKCSDTTYQLRHNTAGWLVNIYPGKCRIYTDPNKPKAPYLNVPTPWTLGDVVDAAIAACHSQKEGEA